MSRSRIYFLTILLFNTLFLHAQHLSNSIGVVMSVSPIKSGIEIAASNAKTRVLVYSPTVFRISITKQTTFDDFSYAVIMQPEFSGFKWEETNSEVIVTTDSSTLKISKNPYRISLYTKNGQVINEDEAAFGTNWTGDEVTTYKHMQDGERFIGLGEKTGNLDRKGEGYTNWNTDYFGYPSGADPIYATIPFYIGIHHQITYGLFMDNTTKSHFNFGASNTRFSSFGVEAGDMNYYLISNQTIAGIIKSYTDLTGRMEIPSMWSIGFQQCRYSYYPESEVLTLAKTFRDKQIPADVIYFDIHYMDQYKIFTWNKERFPNPSRMLGELDKMGFKNVVIVDPGIKVEKGYKSYEEGVARDLFIKYPDGSNYTAGVWPGLCHFPDFTKPATREWWGKSFEGYIQDGIDGFWNDMNEPATWGQKIPSLVEAYYDGQYALHRKWHNVYGMQMARATFEGSKKLLNGKRPMILTRAAYSGIQRYSAIWTGDNRPEDDHMLVGVRLVNSLGLSGVANAGYDVGGFAGEASKELFARWIQVGSFCPFFRNHKMIDAKESEPWSYGEKVESIAKNYISLRYRLLPYVYSAFYEASKTGLPVARSLAINYTFDPMIYDWNYQNQYLFGPSLLICPLVSNKEISKIYAPAGNIWYGMFDEKIYEGGKSHFIETPLEILPVLVKGSSIIPMQSQIQSTVESPEPTLLVHVYKGNENNTFTWYEDAGDGYSYEKGEYSLRVFTYDASKNQLSISAKEGSFASKFQKIRFIMHGYTNNSFKVDGKSENTGTMQVKFIEGLPDFDPLGSKTKSDSSVLKTIEINNDSKTHTISWK